MFAYFKGNGEDGLHLATSADGYTWTALRGDNSFLKPTVSPDKLMRDPSIIRGQGGLFQAYTPAQVLYDQGFNAIDATIQPEGKCFVMFLKDETPAPPQKSLRVAFADRATGPYGPPSAPITGPYWAEGTTAIRVGGRWLVYFDKYAEHKYGAIQSTDLQHWTDVSDRVHFPDGTRHGTVLRLTPAELASVALEPVIYPYLAHPGPLLSAFLPFFP